MEKEEAYSNKLEIQSDDGLNSSNSPNNSLSNPDIDKLNSKKDVLINMSNNSTNSLICENDEKLNLNVHHKCLKHKTYGNIGRNVVLFNRIVLGPKTHFYLLILIVLGMFVSFYLWVYVMGNFYPKILYNILQVPFLLTQIFMFISYAIEPGIIPRNHPDFKIDEEKNK